MLWVMWTAGWRRWWPLPNGLKWLPVLAASKGLGAFCCLGLLLCCCLGNKLRWGVLFRWYRQTLKDLPVRLGQESFGSRWLGWCRDIDLNGISINYQITKLPPDAPWCPPTWCSAVFFKHINLIGLVDIFDGMAYINAKVRILTLIPWMISWH